MTDKRLIPVFLLTFVNVLGFSIVIPVLPFIVDFFGVDRIWFGILLSAYALSMFFGAPVLGALSDSHGRKPLLIISHIGTVLSWVIFGLAFLLPTTPVFGVPLPIWVILFSRILDGITGGNNSIVNAYLADITKPADRTKYFGLIGATFGVGFMIGPALGGWTSGTSLGFLGTIITAFSISLLTLFFVIRYLDETVEKKGKAKIKQRLLSKINVPMRVLEYRTRPKIFATLLLKIAIIFCFSGFTAVLSLFNIDMWGWTATGIGNFLLVIGAFQIFNQIILVPRFNKRFGSVKTLAIAVSLVAIGVAFTPFMPNVYVFVAFSYVFSLGIALSFPTIKGILSSHAGKDEQGEVLGIDEGLQAAGQGVMPLISTSLYVVFGGLIYTVYGALLAVAAISIGFWAYRATSI